MIRLGAFLVACTVLGVAAAVHPVLPFVLLAGVLGGALVVRSPFTILLIFLGVLFTRPADLVPALSALMLGKLLSAGALGLFGLQRMLSRDATWARSPFNRWMALLSIGVLASSLLSVDRAGSMGVFTDVFIKIIIIYVLALNLLDTPKRVVQMHVFMACVCAFIACYAIWAKLTGKIVFEGTRAAYVGILGDPNDLSLALLMYIPFLLEGVMGTRGLKRLGLAAVLVCLVMGIVHTQSRGGFMSLAAALGVMFHDRGSLKLKLMLAPVGLLAVLGLFIASGATGRSSGGSDTEGLDESAQGRLDAWKAGGRMFARHPILGVGFTRFAISFESYASDAVIWGEHETHNAYIKVAAETGLAGLVPFMSLVVLTFRAGWRLRKYGEAEDPLERACQRAKLSAFAGFCLCAFFLSQCWSWFFYIMFVQAAAMERVWEKPLAEREAAARAAKAEAASVRAAPAI